MMVWTESDFKVMKVGTIEDFLNVQVAVFYSKGARQMTNIYKDAGERIFLIRNMRGYTRDALAEMAEITPKFLYEIETGKKGFSGHVLYNLCRALDVDSDYILTGKQGTVYDDRLVRTLELFEKGSTEKIVNVLKAIYDMM